MGIFDKLFNINNDVDKGERTQSNVDSALSFDSEINEVLKILENLGVLDSRTIDERVKILDDYNASILKRIMIKTDEENISNIKKYFDKARLGYGSIKIKQFRSKINELVSEKIEEGANKSEVVEEIIQYARSLVEDYERVLIKFNETVGNLEKSSMGETDLLAMMDYWTNYYKEQELGYPINLQSKVNELALELSQLPYGGYGQDEIDKFVEAANKMIEEAKTTGEESNQTLDRIKSSLHDPKVKRYMADVESLKKKLQMIDDSPYLNEIDREQNKQQTIREFNQMNGHKPDISYIIDDFKRNLTSLEYGGFGSIIVDKFKDKAIDLTVVGKDKGLSQDEIVNQIRAEYDRLMQEYNQRLVKLKERLQNNQTDDISLLEKVRKEKEYIEDFNDEMGHPINFEERISKMADNLKDILDGGYGENKINEFKKQALEMVEGKTTPTDAAKAVREVRKLYYKMIEEYKALKEKHSKAKKDVETDRRMSLDEKKEKSSELDRFFDMEVGRAIDYDKIISNFAEELASLGKVGYGKKTLDEYRSDCQSIVASDIDDATKYQRIKQKFVNLKDRYMVNQNTFNEWKFLQLKNIKGQEKEELAKDLDTKIAYMLSLSPKELTEYYLEDDRKKNEERKRHNFKIAYKFLAKQEARRKKDETIYSSRMEEFENGNFAYSDDEIEDATARIARIELTADDIPNEDRLISVVEYIDSTLLRQMTYVEAATSRKKYVR